METEMEINMRIQFILILKPIEYGIDFSKKEKSILHDIQHKWKFHMCKISKNNATFEFDSNSQIANLYKDELIQKYKNFFNHDVYCNTIYELEDMEKAVAYELYFKNDCITFDEDEKYYNYELVCKHLELKELRSHLYIKGFKRNLKGANTEKLEAIIAPDIYQNLREKKLPSKFFRPMFNTREDVIAYYIDGSCNLLPPKVIYNSNQKFWHTCCGCDAVSMGKHTYFMKEPEIHIHGNESLDITYINECGLQNLDFCNQTYEYDYFLGIRKTIVNKTFFALLCEQIPEIKGISKPIFLATDKMEFDFCYEEIKH